MAFLKGSRFAHPAESLVEMSLLWCAVLAGCRGEGLQPACTRSAWFDTKWQLEMSMVTCPDNTFKHKSEQCMGAMQFLDGYGYHEVIAPIGD